MTAINFYILSSDKKLIPFICQLTQTVLQKSQDGLIILASSDILPSLDDKLWSFSDTAFIPHRIVKTFNELSNYAPIEAVLTDTSELLTDFHGSIINLTKTALITTIPNTGEKIGEKNNKILEIIAHDEPSVIAGRQKYRAYRDTFPNLPIQTFKI